jgi:hypothetical protein
MEITKDPTSLLSAARTDRGFLASAVDISNYKRIWARDGVICGLAALLDGNESLITTFKKTLMTLASHQHELGHIPSNVFYKDEDTVEVSFGGLAGRVDTISWFIIGVCNYVDTTGDTPFLGEMMPKMTKGLQLLKAWEFNNNHLIYVPRSGNWADEYITEGHIFYDQVLRLWAMRCIHKLKPTPAMEEEISVITAILEGNYKAGTNLKPYHPRAYKALLPQPYWMASINPSGYQTMFDALGNSIALLLGLGNKNDQADLILYCEELRNELPLQLLPAFWKPIKKGDKDWELLLHNCKYEFRNHAYEFHNGGTWQMVNGFYGMALAASQQDSAQDVLKNICSLNAREDYGYYENFNSKTSKAIGVKHCTWSAAGELLVIEYLNGKRLLI